MNKVNKRKVRPEILSKTKFVLSTKRYLKYIKRIRDPRYWSFIRDIDERLETEKHDLEMLKKQLTCKHPNTETTVTMNYHKGNEETEIKCKDCEFVLQWE